MGKKMVYLNDQRLHKILNSKLMTLEKLDKKRSAHILKFYKHCSVYAREYVAECVYGTVRDVLDIRLSSFAFDVLGEAAFGEIYKFMYDEIKATPVKKETDFLYSGVLESREHQKYCHYQAKIITMIFRSAKYRCQQVSRHNRAGSEMCNASLPDNTFFKITEKLARQFYTGR